MIKIGVVYKSIKVSGRPFAKRRIDKVYRIFSSIANDVGADVFFGHSKDLTRQGFRRSCHYEGGWSIKRNIDLDFIINKGSNYEWMNKIDPSIKVLNDRYLARIADDKLLCAKIFKKYSPKTFSIERRSDLEEALKKIKTEKVVLKPRFGYEGIGIYIRNRGSVNAPMKNYIIQEFIDTSSGIKGLVSGIHDLRLVILNGEVVDQYTREPKRGLISNTSRGGIEKYFKREEIPKSVIRVAMYVDRRFCKIFPRFYSIDFLVDKCGKPWVCELNASPGLYPGDMKDMGVYKKLYKKLLISIINHIKCQGARPLQSALS